MGTDQLEMAAKVYRTVKDMQRISAPDYIKPDKAHWARFYVVTSLLQESLTVCGTRWKNVTTKRHFGKAFECTLY